MSEQTRGVLGRLNLILLWLAAAAYAAVFLKLALVYGFLGQDAHAYWSALQGGPLYEARARELDAYPYSPAFAQLFTPLGWLPWWPFYVLWVALEGAALVWLLRPLPTRWAVPAFLACVPELVIGNIYALLGLMVALGVRAPAAWVFGALTKITPGVGMVWLLARRDWQGLAAASGVTLAVAATSALVAPGDWLGWFHQLTSTSQPDPTFYPRCVIAVGLAALAVRPGRAWLLAVAVVMAIPVFAAVACLVPLAAIPRLLEWERMTKAPRLPEQTGGERAEVGHALPRMPLG